MKAIKQLFVFCMLLTACTSDINLPGQDNNCRSLTPEEKSDTIKIDPAVNDWAQGEGWVFTPTK